MNQQLLLNSLNYPSKNRYLHSLFILNDNILNLLMFIKILSFLINFTSMLFIVTPVIIVTFGRIANNATQLIEKYELTYKHIFKQSVVVDGWYERTIIATAHPHARISTTRRDKNKKDLITLLRRQIIGHGLIRRDDL